MTRGGLARCARSASATLTLRAQSARHLRRIFGLQQKKLQAARRSTQSQEQVRHHWCCVVAAEPPRNFLMLQRSLSLGAAAVHSSRSVATEARLAICPCHCRLSTVQHVACVHVQDLQGSTVLGVCKRLQCRHKGVPLLPVGGLRARVSRKFSDSPFVACTFHCRRLSTACLLSISGLLF